MTDGIYLLLGSNLGDKRNNLVKARKLIEDLVGIIDKSSSIYETDAWGKVLQPTFLNQVVKISSWLTPEDLLVAIQQIEISLGRIRHEKWGERTIDIDILYYSGQIIKLPNLVIPHPEIQFRRFTLIPLAEISPQLIHPVLQKSNKQLLILCADNLAVKPLTPYGEKIN